MSRYRDSCNVYAVSHPGGTIFVNAGTGHWLDDLPARFKAPHTLLSTHYFRDHAAGAANASRRGMRVFAPAGEIEIFADPEQHFRERKTYIIYDNIWDTFAPIEPAEAHPAHDYATLDLGGLVVSVRRFRALRRTIPAMRSRFRDRAAASHFRGRRSTRLDAWRGSRRSSRLSGSRRRVNAYWAVGELRRGDYEALLPSLGEPILPTRTARLRRWRSLSSGSAPDGRTSARS
jgi:hypothetical protein